MKISCPSFRGRLLLALVLVAFSGCSTLRYRSVQSQFEDAVRADNERFAMPFTDADSAYQAVAQQLTPGYIAQLDPKLRPNAWTLRSVSLWRSGQSAQAISNSFEGLAEITRLKEQLPQIEHSRDSIILTMLPGLAEDTRLRDRLRNQGSTDVAAHYEDHYAPKFKAAVRALAEARSKAAAPTPSEVLYYWDYQCWRVLANWLYIIGKLPLVAQADANNQADAFVRSSLADAGLQEPTTLPKAMNSAENALPTEHPYRKLIALERQL
jgi:hypothetical protein